MMDQLEASRLDAVVSAIGGRNFVAFEELAEVLDVPVDSVVGYKAQLEEAVRTYDDGLRLTSRVDLVPPGFEIDE